MNKFHQWSSLYKKFWSSRKNKPIWFFVPHPKGYALDPTAIKHKIHVTHLRHTSFSKGLMNYVSTGGGFAAVLDKDEYKEKMNKVMGCWTIRDE